jgi:hypothetical protein
MTVVLAWVALALTPTLAWPILLETGSKQRVAGYVVREDAGEIAVRVLLPDGKEKVEVFERAKVKVLHQVDRKRLEKLSKENPKAYRDYAEELARQPADPEATDLAMRLLVIAAYLDPAKLGTRSLLEMSDLAIRPADVRKYRAMAFLLDARGDPAVLKLDAIKPAPLEGKPVAKILATFQRALKAYRHGDLATAREAANQKGVSEYFSKTGLTDVKSFLQQCESLACKKCGKTGVLKCTECNGTGMVPNNVGGFEACPTCGGKKNVKCSACDGDGLNSYPEDYYRTLLRAEIWTLDQLLGLESPVDKNLGASWSVLPQRLAVPLLNLETISPYDPRKCLFRDGNWVAP